MKRMQRVFGDLDALLHVDGRLEEERKAAFLAHLGEEPQEAERVATWSRQNDVIRATFASIAVEPVPLWLRLGHVAAERSTVREMPIGTERAHRVGPHLVEARGAALRAEPSLALEAALPSRKRQRSTSIGISAAVLLIIGLIVLAVAHTLMPQAALSDDTARGDGDETGALVVRAVDSYRTYALDPARPVEIPASQQVLLDRWLQRRLAMPVHAPDLREEGWTALGGRLVPGEAGPAAYYLYESAPGERLGIYMTRSTTMPTSALTLDPMAGGGSVLSWVSGQTAYVVTVGKSLDWLSRNAETLRADILKPSSAD